MLLVLFPAQIFVISQAEPRLPLQLEDAVRPDGEGEEVRMNVVGGERARVVYVINSKILAIDLLLLCYVRFWMRPKSVFFRYTSLY